MTDDIVARLRWWKGEIGELFEAADKIERLKNQISHIIEHNNPQIEQANSYFKLLEEELARCNKIIDDYEEEHSKLRERRDDWSAAMAENHDLWRENERLQEEIQQLKHDSTIFINERSDAICENFDLREENAELREIAIAALKEGGKKDD